MKKIGAIILLGLFCIKVNAQLNLVPNPGFEDTISCPLGGDQLYKAVNWFSCRGTPDYFHSCCIMINCAVGVPQNDLGYQFAHKGNAYGGMISYDLTGAPYREYLGVQLQTPTIVNQKYYLTFHLSWSGKPGFTIAHNKIGCSLSTIPYSQSNPFGITNSPKSFSDTIYSDSLNWSMVQLSFIADSSYEYLILGNFFDDFNTDTINLGQFNVHSYYYIDDVCLSIDSFYCSYWTGVQSLYDTNQILLCPNPANSNFKILGIEESFIIKIFNSSGKMIVNEKYDESEDIVDTSPFPNGLYLISIHLKSHIINKKFLVYH